MSRVLLDTSTYIAHLIDPFREGFQRRSEGVFVTPIVLGELRAGFFKGSKAQHNLRLLAVFLSSPRVQTVVIDDDTSERYAQIHDFLRRTGRPIPVNDIWIAASARLGLFKKLRVEEDTVYKNYRRFQTDSRIVASQ